MVKRSRFNQTLSPRAAVAVCIAAAILGWAAVLGLIYTGRAVSQYIEATMRSNNSLNQIAPAGGQSGEPHR